MDGVTRRSTRIRTMIASRTNLLLNLSDPRIPADLLDSALVSLRKSTSVTPIFEEIRILLPQDSSRACATRANREASWIFERDRSLGESVCFAARSAKESGASLLVLDGPSLFDSRAVTALENVLDRDPYFAFALPRLSGYGRELIRKLDETLGDPEFNMIPRSVVDDAPEYYLIPDRIESCVLIRANVVRDFWPLEQNYETLWGMLRDLEARARQAGFRCVVANRAVIEASDISSFQDTSANRRDREKISARFPESADLERLWREFPEHERESLLGRASSASVALNRTLLLDLSDLGAIRNGTSEATLGILRGLRSSAGHWSISLLVSPEIERFHRLREDFPEFEIEWPNPSHRFTAVLRLNQPWSLATLIRLHKAALFNFVFVHDTILGDMFRGSPMGLDQVWRFLAKNADGLIYNSDFTRQRFRTRYPVDSRVDECVAYLSCHPSDYRKEIEDLRSEPYLFVVGNQYPHKWMKQTIEILSSAFPFEKLRALGYEDPSVPNLESLSSGHISENVIDQLYAGAWAVVYPSQYEGFGFPVIRALSYGKTVIARKSALLSEIAERYRGPGRLWAFETEIDLVEAVGRVLHGMDWEETQLGSALASSEEPDSWREVADVILHSIEERTRKPESSNWECRQEKMDAMELHASVLQDWGAE